MTLGRSAYVRGTGLSAWMVREDVAVPCRGVDMGVDFRSSHTFMSEHLLNDTQIRAIFYQVRSKGVSESMR